MNSEHFTGLHRIEGIEHCEGGISLEAAKQTFRAQPYHKDQFKISNQIWSENKLPTELCPIPLRGYLGRKRGRLTVVGYYGQHPSGSRVKFQFVAQCQCGAFQVITNKSLDKPDNGGAMCGRCTWHEHTKWAYDNNPEWKGKRE